MLVKLQLTKVGAFFETQCSPFESTGTVLFSSAMSSS